jgi:hypothetical protein
MAMASKSARRPLIDDRLTELLELIKGADSVELKLTVPDSNRRSAVAALDMDPLDAQIRQVYFFDTPDLALDKKGIVVRARRSQGRADDSVVKLRPVVPGDLPAKLRALREFVVEVDAMPGGYVCSASYRGTVVAADVKSTVAAGLPLRKLFSKGQRAFFASHAPEGIALDDLSVLGPITVLKLKFPSPEGQRKMVAELWTYPDGTRILELSTKCLPSEALQVAIEAKALLSRIGVDLTGTQETKTRTALTILSQGLAARDAQGAGAGGAGRD